MADLSNFFLNQTIIPTIGFQARDWFLLTNNIFNNDIFEDIIYQLKISQRVVNSPSGSTIIDLSDVNLGVIYVLFMFVNDVNGKEVGKSARNRIRAVLETLIPTYSDIALFLNTVDNNNIDLENNLIERGRKILRGKLG